MVWSSIQMENGIRHHFLFSIEIPDAICPVFKHFTNQTGLNHLVTGHVPYLKTQSNYARCVVLLCHKKTNPPLCM